MNRIRLAEIAIQWSGGIARGLRLPIAWKFVMSPPGGLTALVVIAGTCGFVIERFTLILAAIGLVVLLLGVAWPRVIIFGLRASLDFSRERTSEGHSVEAVASVSNLWPLPVWGLVVEGLSDCSPQTSVALPAVWPWSTATYTWPFQVCCRGVYPGQELKLATSFPFGLVTGRRRIQCPNPLLVAPQAFPVEMGVPTGADLPGDHNSRLRSSGGSGDLMGVRPYRKGDTLRRVHWAQTAKHQQLIVCEREAFVRPAVELVVDLSPETHVGTAPNGSLEWCLRVAISICRSIVAKGGHVRCHLGDRVFKLGGRPNEWRLFLDGLAVIPRQGLSLCEPQLTQRYSPLARIVIASDASDLAAAGQQAGHPILIVLQSSAFGGTLSNDRRVHRVPVAARCIVLDGPERVASQLGPGRLQMEAGRC